MCVNIHQLNIYDQINYEMNISMHSYRYSDRPEVQAWQEATKAGARRTRAVRTLMGRYRDLPDAAERGPSGGHALRAAINTPIQVYTCTECCGTNMI